MKEIPLTKGYVAQVDDEDYEHLSQFRWTARIAPHTVYGIRSDKGVRIPMHREIMKPEPHLFVDHIDRNGLNNQRANWRVCTKAQNQANRRQKHNTSGRVGVAYLDPSKPHNARYAARPYKASVMVNGQQFCAGYFATLEEAAVERDRAAVFYHGDFAVLNYPERLEEYKAHPYSKAPYRRSG
jgi:hypothetical protein